MVLGIDLGKAEVRLHLLSDDQLIVAQAGEKFSISPHGHACSGRKPRVALPESNECVHKFSLLLKKPGADIQCTGLTARSPKTSEVRRKISAALLA